MPLDYRSMVQMLMMNPQLIGDVLPFVKKNSSQPNAASSLGATIHKIRPIDIMKDPATGMGREELVDMLTGAIVGKGPPR